VKKIDVLVFEGCTNLKTATLPSSITSCSNSSFDSNENLIIYVPVGFNSSIKENLSLYYTVIVQ